ncbi:MAG: hypothetical protein J0M08_02185 [Bacteroidetes bacterium]|nr:hypothetical protein [Bacteroidota bacterium]
MILLLLSSTFNSFSQNILIGFDNSSAIPPSPSKPELKDALSASQRGENLNVLYRNESSFGILAHSNGFGANYRRGKHITAKKKGILEVEFVTMRHPKEVKIKNQSYQNSKGFFYGKVNSLFLIRPGVGYQKVLFDKAERKSVQIRLGTFLGASLGFAKPVYLEILQPSIFPGEFNVKEEKYNSTEHYPDNIYGRAPYLRGFDEMKIYPGGYAKLALSVEYADHNEEIKAIETGISVDVFPKTIPIMALTQNNQVMVNLYVSMVFGKKWF